MADNWYFVENNDRKGPVQFDELAPLLKNGPLTKETYVWKKGMTTWIKAFEVEEFKNLFASEPEEDEVPMVMPEMLNNFDWSSVDHNDKRFMIKIGADRGCAETEYGPYSLNMIKRLRDQKRVNDKTYIFTTGMANWIFLADMPIFEDLFKVVPPKIEDNERRKNVRRPFIARMFFADNSQVYEGVCRDISIGGMQIMVAGSPVRVGQTISLNVHPDNTESCFTAKGKVIRMVDGDCGFSLRFEGLDEAALKAIKASVEK